MPNDVCQQRPGYGTLENQGRRVLRDEPEAAHLPRRQWRPGRPDLWRCRQASQRTRHRCWSASPAGAAPGDGRPGVAIADRLRRAVDRPGDETAAGGTTNLNLTVRHAHRPETSGRRGGLMDARRRDQGAGRGSDLVAAGLRHVRNCLRPSRPAVPRRRGHGRGRRPFAGPPQARWRQVVHGRPPVHFRLARGKVQDNSTATSANLMLFHDRSFAKWDDPDCASRFRRTWLMCAAPHTLHPMSPVIHMMRGGDRRLQGRNPARPAARPCACRRAGGPGTVARIDQAGVLACARLEQGAPWPYPSSPHCASTCAVGRYAVAELASMRRSISARRRGCRCGVRRWRGRRGGNREPVSAAAFAARLHQLAQVRQRVADHRAARDIRGFIRNALRNGGSRFSRRAAYSTVPAAR